MKKDITVFAVSDIHGHATLLKKALNDAGFNPDNDRHLLVCCGDVFDRGHENYDVLKFFERTKNKVMIRGNHEDMLEEILRDGRLKMHHFHNGTAQTICDLFGKYALDNEFGWIDFSGQTSQLNRVEEFIGEMIDYFETDHYVFTHGWLPTAVDGSRVYISPDFRRASRQEWQQARWNKWNNMFHICDRLPDKTIVCGHSSTHYAAQFDNNRTPDTYTPFHAKGLIALDACTILSRQLYVTVLEDTLSVEE